MHAKMHLQMIVLLFISLSQAALFSPLHNQRRSILEKTITVNDIDDLSPTIATMDDDIITVDQDLYAIVLPTNSKEIKNNFNQNKRDIKPKNNESPFNRLDLLEAFLAKNLTSSKFKQRSTETIRDTTTSTTTESYLPSIFEPRKPPLRLKPKEAIFGEKRELTSAEKLEKTNRSFDRMLRFVGIVGQVDRYISDQARLIVRKLAAMYDEEARFNRGH